MRSTRHATSARGSSTRCCRSRAKARRTGGTRGFPCWRRSPAASSERSPSTRSTPGETSRRRRVSVAKYAAALDQGTTSTRCMIFNHGGEVVSVAQKEHEQIYPKPGWVEHDPQEIWARTKDVIDEALDAANATADDISGVGITNQRETTVVWDRSTGEPVMNAIVWQDTRTDRLVHEFSPGGGQDRVREQT